MFSTSINTDLNFEVNYFYFKIEQYKKMNVYNKYR